MPHETTDGASFAGHLTTLGRRRRQNGPPEAVESAAGSTVATAAECAVSFLGRPAHLFS